jgi:DNA-binding response OmpR family regulator
MARILIVEDNLDLLAILRHLLGVDHEVATAHRGEEGIEIAVRFRPDVVILDLQLPRMDGIETGHRIKKHFAPEPMPILILTAHAQAGDPEAVLRSGCCDAYLAKPAPIDAIRAKVNELLESRERAA